MIPRENKDRFGILLMDKFNVLINCISSPLVPVADSIVVLAMLVFFIREPIRILRTALGEVAGVAAPDDEYFDQGILTRDQIERYYTNPAHYNI